MPGHVVATVAEIPPGGRKIVVLAGRSIGVFNVGGRFYAVRNQCPHAGAKLCEGVLTGLVTSTGPGEYDYRRRGEILRCPWHGWEFDLATGRSWFDPERTRVAAYEVTTEDMATPPEDADLIEAGKRPGPYTAERYPVEVVDRQVVVHL